MKREQREDVIRRLETYLGYTREQASDITRQVCYALDIYDGEDVFVMTDTEVEAEHYRGYAHGAREGHREGYMDAIDDVRPLVNGVIAVELGKLQANYLDNH